MKMLMHQIKDWGPGAVAMGHEQNESHPHSRVLGEMLSFELKSPRHCLAFLQVADKVKAQGGNASAVWHDKAWRVEIRPAEIKIEYEFDDMGDDWKAVFPFDHVRRAVKGWMQFLELPESPERQLVVDLDAD